MAELYVNDNLPLIDALVELSKLNKDKYFSEDMSFDELMENWIELNCLHEWLTSNDGVSALPKKYQNYMPSVMDCLSHGWAIDRRMKYVELDRFYSITDERMVRGGVEQYNQYLSETYPDWDADFMLDFEDRDIINYFKSSMAIRGRNVLSAIYIYCDNLRQKRLL